MQRILHPGVIALALLASAGFAVAQQTKTQENSADEALTRSAPEAKQEPQAPPHISPTQASEPGKDAQPPALTDGKLATPAAPQGTQDEPAKFSAKNDAIDDLPIMAYPMKLTDDQRRTIYERLSQGQAPVLNITAKPSEQVPATTAFQEMPKELADQFPLMRDYKFVRVQDKILLVNPRESIVVGEFKK
jgi:hypothetical protein